MSVPAPVAKRRDDDPRPPRPPRLDQLDEDERQLTLALLAQRKPKGDAK